MSKYYLEVSGDYPKWWPAITPKRIPIVTGSHLKEWDVVEAEMPDGWRAEYNTAYREHFECSQVYEDKPVGFSSYELPEYAKIIEID